jgi:hypothetical protein
MEHSELLKDTSDKYAITTHRTAYAVSTQGPQNFSQGTFLEHESSHKSRMMYTANYTECPAERGTHSYKLQTRSQLYCCISKSEAFRSAVLSDARHCMP